MARHIFCAALLLLVLGSTAWAQSGPQIQVHEGTTIPPGSTGIPDNSGTVLFDATPVGVPQPKTFTVRNVGTANLTLTEPITLPPGFTLVSSFGTTTVAPGGTTTFAVALNPAKAGRLTGPLSFRTNDTARTSFDFTVVGPSLAPAAVGIVNDGQAGFSVVGTWTPVTPRGFHQDARTSPSGTGTNTASWTFTGLVPGQYRVAATWPEAADRASNAPYTVLDGPTALTTVAVNQRTAPASFSDGGTGWRDLGTVFRITGNTLTVRLSDQANGVVAADAVRIQRLGYQGETGDAGPAVLDGTWTAVAGAGFQRAVHTSPAGKGENTATWSFAGLIPGQYRVSATWTAGTNRATNAPYNIVEGYRTLATVVVNQQQAPSHFSDAGVAWHDLGGEGNLFTVTGYTLTVTLSNAASGVVVADAVRVERVNTPVVESIADTVRFLQQATWGPNKALVQRVQAIGFENFLNEQFGAAPSSYPTLPLMHNDSSVGCPVGPPGATCRRDNYSMYPLQKRFFLNALYGEDQLRQRVAFALHQIIVVSGIEIYEPSWMVPYLQTLDRNAFGNYGPLLREITLNPAMGRYLDLATSTRVQPNENYAREVLELFSIGLEELHPDGTPKVDAQGNRIPTYEQATVDNLTRALTGWIFRPQLAPGVPNYIDPLIPNTGRHDTGAKTLLRGVTLPAGRTVQQDLDDALNNIFNHPNVGPFIGKQLIQHLVTSNPSPAYVARVAAVFDNNGATPPVRGDLKAVVKAILLDPEARGDSKTDPHYGHLRHPALLLCNLARAFGARSADGTGPSDGVLNPQCIEMGMDVFRPPTVFSYFSPGNVLTGTPGVLGPEFTILATNTTLARANVINTLVFSQINASANAPAGTSLDLTGLVELAGTPTRLVDELDLLLLHGTMSAAMRDSILQAGAAADPLKRARAALYLVATSSQYQVQR
jgi:uncharacterized protein (DUF1800 family)